MQATTIIPIVMTDAGDPVGTGLVASLAQPGGNVTGLSNTSPDLVSKRLELLKEAAPSMARVAVLAHPPFAATHRLPTICGAVQFAEAGCLLSYSASHIAMYRRAAFYVDKILKGTQPADLPVEQPIKFELVINLKTAQALGLTIPPSLLFQANEVIR
jgi:putative ABC transport system substrate-binding protein